MVHLTNPFVLLLPIHYKASQRTEEASRLKTKFLKYATAVACSQSIEDPELVRLAENIMSYLSEQNNDD